MEHKKNIKGYIYVIISSIFFASYGIWSKLMSDSFDDFTQAWLRGLIVVLILLPIGLFTKKLKSIYKPDLKWFLVFSIPGSLVFPFYFIGFRYLEIGTATLLFYSSLTITSYILGVIFFKEKMNILKMISLALGLMGLLVICKVTFDLGNIIPAIITILAGICGSIEVVFSKKVSVKYSSLQLTTFLYSIDIIINFTINLFVSKSIFTLTTDTIAWFSLIMYSISGLFAFLFVSLGYKRLEPSVAGIIGLLEIPFGIIFGIALFSEVLELSTIIGGVLIILASALPSLKQVFKRNTQI
ncbi:DMT family transporter [Patescibacteria group bacterium]